MYDIKYLITLLERATPDSINIAEAILNNHEINIPELPALRQAVHRSLSEKKNLQLSQSVREIKLKIIADIRVDCPGFRTSITVNLR